MVTCFTLKPGQKENCIKMERTTKRHSQTQEFAGYQLTLSNHQECSSQKLTITTVPLNYNYIFTGVDMHSATTQVRVVYVSTQHEIYMTRVFHTCNTCGYFTCSLHAWIFHTIYMRGLYLWHCYLMLVLPVLIAH